MTSRSKELRDAINDAFEMGHYAIVELLSGRYLERFPNDVGIWVTRGRALDADCRWAEADAAFEEAARCGDKNSKMLIWLSKASSFKHRGQFSEAEEYFAKVIEIAPNYSWFQTSFALATRSLGNLPLAEERLRKSISLKGDEQDEALYFLGSVLVALGRLEEAANCYREALALSPDYEIAKTRLADVEAALRIESEEN